MSDGKTVIVALRVTEEERKIFQEMAEARGQNVSEMIRSIMLSEDAIMGEFPPILKEALIKAAQALHLPVSTLMLHILIRRFAFDGSYRAKFGPSENLWKEFYFEDTADGVRRLVTGQELLDAMTEDYDRLFDEFKQAIKELYESAGESEIEAREFVKRFGDFVAAH